MKHTLARTLFIFRRDLRLNDNTALYHALREATEVIPCFIFDPRQLEDNPYLSANALAFMSEALDDLNAQLQEHDGKLYRFYGQTHVVVQELITNNNIDAIYANRDYTPFSIRRDKALADVCNKKNVTFNLYDDALLHAPEAVLKKDGKPYTVFTPYFRAAQKHPIAPIIKPHSYNFFTGTLPHSNAQLPATKASPQRSLYGGRTAALTLIKQLNRQKKYESTRDIPAISTSHLSAHLKFGTISVRELLHAIMTQLGNDHPLVRQLYWRDFFTMIGYWFPHVFGHAFKHQYDNITWSTNKATFTRWCEGTTGFPIVDAGMRELNATGFMHNRVRMIVGSFLVKDLGIDWRMGERYFATKLVDYDPAVNNGNWQWVASTGCDAQPYFRIFNPWLQQKKYDPDARYIKQWIPELRQTDPKQIHLIFKKAIVGYPSPIVNHTQSSSLIKNWFKKESL